jgi:hypothetical protein
VWRAHFGRGWSMLPEILLLALNVWTESQETWTSPGKRASGLTQVIIVLLGLLHPSRDCFSLVRRFFPKIFKETKFGSKLC